MGLRRSAPVVTEVIEADLSSASPTHGMRSLVAAAAALKMDTGHVMRNRVTDEEWQREAWRLFDIVGEMRFAANRHAAGVSRCRLYVAEVDETGAAGKEVTDPEISGLAESIFGGPAGKAEYLRTCAIQLYVGGESYIVAESPKGKAKDLWYVVTAAQIRKATGGGYKVKRPQQHGGGWYELNQSRDLIMRCWTPHPRDYDLADSPTRAALPILREIERLTLLTFSQIDSRLISAGLLLLPKGLSFPDENGDNTGLRGLLEMILEVAQAQLTGAGTAAGLVPVLGEIPAGTGSDIQHIRFETALTAEIKDKLDHAVRRLATSLDCSVEDLLGQGKSNHWSSFNITDEGVKLFIEPVVARICDALTRAYLAPALELIGKDPDKYTLWYSAAALTARPNRFEDALQLWDRGVLSDDELRKAANFTEHGGTKRNQLQWMAWTLLKANPDLLKNPEIVKLAGLPAAVIQEPEPEPAMLPRGDGLPEVMEESGRLPDRQDAQDRQETLFAALLPGAEQAVLRALEMAGGRLAGRRRWAHDEVEKFALHTVIEADRERAQDLLVGAFAHVPALAQHHGISPNLLSTVLHQYCTELIIRKFRHEPGLLGRFLERGLGG